MDVQFRSQPNLLMETLDLVYAYVNQLDPSVLTSDRLYCVPSAELKRIMDHVCKDLNREHWMLRFYFQSYPIENMICSSLPGTCVAYMLLYQSMRIDTCDVQQIRSELHRYDFGGGTYYEICGCSQFGLSIRSCPEYRSIAMELQSLDIPDELRLRLAEALSNYHRHVDQLCDLLEPVARRLLPFLETWWEQTKPRMELWKTALGTQEGIRNFLKKVNVDTDGLRHLHIGFRIFSSGSRSGVYDLSSEEIFFAIGTDISAQRDPDEAVPALTQMQVTALRLLSSMDRIEMLRAMSDRVMTPKELTVELGLKPGSVFRDLNNLFQSHLVEIVIDGVHRSYKTDMRYLEELLLQLLRYLKKQDEA